MVLLATAGPASLLPNALHPRTTPKLTDSDCSEKVNECVPKRCRPAKTKPRISPKGLPVTVTGPSKEEGTED